MVKSNVHKNNQSFLSNKHLNYFVLPLLFTFWPLSIFFANTPPNFLNYLLPTLLVVVSYFLFRKKGDFYLLPAILIPFIQPKLAVLPLLLVIVDALFFSKKLNKLLLISSLVVLLIFGKSFINQSIFIKDYNAQQSVIRKTLLYPNVLLARTFQNKARIYIDKANDNFFALTDPNNYFFGFQPRQITVNNQNLDKYPFIAIIFFIVGLYYFQKSDGKKFITVFALGSIISLSLLTNFDRHDFILWLPMGLISMNGLKQIETRLKEKTKIIYIVFILFSLAQLVRLFIQYKY